MLTLRELQRQVADELLTESPPSTASLIDSGPGAHSRARFEIYRNNVRSNFTAALRSAFPVVLRLVGDDYFRQIARPFQRLHPSNSGDLNHVGADFADYLRELHPGEFRYLADVAQLEWLIQEALLAGDHEPLDVQALAGLPESVYPELCFTLHPALRLLESKFPVLRIWHANSAAIQEPALLRLDEGGERIAIMRHEGQLKFHPLDGAEHTFLRSLGRRANFASAVHEANDVHAGFDATLALQRFVGTRVVVGFYLPTVGS